MGNIEQKTKDYFKVKFDEIVWPVGGLIRYTRRARSAHNEELDRILEDYPADSEELRDELKLFNSIGNKIEARECNLYIFHVAYAVALVYGAAVSLFS